MTGRVTPLSALVLLLSLLASQAFAMQPAGDPQQLKNLTLEELGNIEVTTEAKEPTQVRETPSAIYVLTNEDIRRSGVTNVPDALRLIPGVNIARVSGSRNWAVGIRGLGDQYSKYVLVLIDGRSIYTTLFGGVLWTINNVMLEDIDRIEVIRGPGRTIWGANAVNGIINIITKSAADTQGMLLSAGGGNTDQNTEDVRYGSQHRAWYYRTDAFGFVRSAEFHDKGQPNYDWSHLGQADLRADRKTATDETTIEAGAYWGRFGDAQGLTTYNPPNYYVSYAAGTGSGGELLGRWRHNLEDGGDIYLQAYWMHDHRMGSNFGEDRDTFDIDYLQRLRDLHRHQISYGGGVRVVPSRITQVAESDQFNPSMVTDSVYSGFFQVEIHLLRECLTLTLGSKTEHNNYTGFEYQPNGRILWTPTNKQSAWLSVTRAVRTPDRVDEGIQVDRLAQASSPTVFARVVGNTNIRAERLVAYEGGYRALLHPSFYITVDAFHNAYHDIIAQGAAALTYAPGTPFPPASYLFTFQYRNGIHGSTDGAEIAPTWQPAFWWKMRAAYSYLHIDLMDQSGFGDLYTLTYVRGSSPNNQAFLSSQINLPDHFEFDQIFRYASALPAQSVKTYETADARLGWNPRKDLSFSVTGQNLFQPHHAEFSIDPPPMVGIKRGIYAKVVWSR